MSDSTWWIVYHRPKNQRWADKVGEVAFKARTAEEAIWKAMQKHPGLRKNRCFAKLLSQDQVEQGTAKYLNMTKPPSPEVEVSIPEMPDDV